MLMRFKQLTLAMCVMAVSAVSGAEVVLVKSQQNIEEYKLDNGFRVILAPNEKENKVFMNTVYFTGALNDPNGKGGLAHLLEHLAFKGSVNVKGDEFQRRLDQYTLMTNASTDYYSTKYTNIVRPDAKALNEIIYLESERMDKLVLQQKFVPSEIEIVKREREIRLDQPFAVLIDQMWKSAYGNQSLGRLPIGDLAELKSIKMPELQRFYRTWYAPNNAVMVIAGKFDKAQVLKQIDQHFSPIPARPVPAQPKVAALDVSQIKQRQFVVKKGSDLARFHIYMDGQNKQLQPILALTPYLYTMQPSGHLYQGMVETGLSTQVQATTWSEKDFNLVFLGAIYAPNHDAQKVEQGLTQGVEQNAPFTETELKRVKNLIQNDHDSLLTNAVAVGSMLSDYVVTEDGNWAQYFADQQRIQQLSLPEVNQQLDAFLNAKHRITGDIQPTPEAQKKAVQQKALPNKTLASQQTPSQALKDPNIYRQEVQQFVTASQQLLDTTEQKIQRGQLKNGLRYALFPTSTRDNKTYATLTVDFGNAQSLFKQGEVLDLMAYLLLRGTDQHSLQEIADRSIAAGGEATAEASGNGVTIRIQAKKEQFADYFNFVLGLMKKPSFEQSQFDLIKAQSLASLNRPYTEPETVAALTMARQLEIYQPGDLRYHFEPEWAKQQLNESTQAKVKQLYQQFFAMNHAQIAITGEFDPASMQKTLEQQLGQWNSQQAFSKVVPQYRSYPAQQLHVLSEQREFGNYQSMLSMPVGIYHADAPALLVLSHILGNSQLSSRLAQELREKNALVYGFGSQLELDAHQDVGALMIEANYTAGKAAQVSQAVHRVLKDLFASGVTEQELEAAKADIMKQRVTSLEDERSIHRMLNSQLELGKTLANRAERDQQIAKLTKADLDRVIQKYLKPEQLVEVMADQYGQPTAKPKS